MAEEGRGRLIAASLFPIGQRSADAEIQERSEVFEAQALAPVEVEAVHEEQGAVVRELVSGHGKSRSSCDLEAEEFVGGEAWVVSAAGAVPTSTSRSVIL